MRTRTIKKEIIPYIVCAGLFALAGILQYIDNEVTIFWDKLLSLVINLIFFLLIFIWGNSAKNRIVEKSTRRLLITVATLMFMWLLLRYVKYYFFASYETASRYLWYMYYIPQCLVPPLAWIAAMGLTRKSSRSVCKCLYLVLVPAVVLILLILTNDLHQTAFVFKENFANFETDYKHGPVYYITMAWLALGMIAAVATLFLKCSISACKKKVWIPLTVFAVCAVVSGLCFAFEVRSYKVPELLCFTFIAIFESCVRIGLIPSNENYEKYFAMSSVSSVITDEELKPVFRTEKLPETGREPYERAKAEGSILLDENTRMSAKSISGGSVFYAENLAAINELLGKLSIVNEELTEEGELITYENDLKERKAKTEEKNRLYSRIFEIVSASLGEVNALVDGIDETSADFEKNLRLACVYLAYIKRRSNLEMLRNRSENIDINEIALSVKESLGCLADCGITTSFVGNASGEYDAKICIFLYEFFEECIKKALPTLSGVIVKLSAGNGKIALRAVVTDAADSVKDFFDDEIKKCNGKVTVAAEDDSLYETLTFETGGAER